MKKALKKNVFKLTLSSLLLTCTACTVVGPDYERPTTEVNNAYKELPENAQSIENAIEIKSNWWEPYNDVVLNELIEKIAVNNFSLQSSSSQLLKAESSAQISRSSQSPSLLAGGRNDFGVLLNWEVDLWGRVQRNIEANEANVQATRADLSATKLSLQAQLANTYFMLRVQDADLDLLKSRIAEYERSLEIANNQYDAGVVKRDIIAQEQAQLSRAKIQMFNTTITRAQLEHAIAVLVGQSPSNFSLDAKPLDLKVPVIPVSLPSQMLERRPDVIAAERRVALASANIGVAEAQALPSLSLFAGATIRRGLIGGSDLEIPLYDDGATKANKMIASAEYAGAVAHYRQTVLESFKEVEDNLVELDVLEQVASSQATALEASQEVMQAVSNQYKAGVVSYQDVIDVKELVLDNQRAGLNLLSRQLITSVNLIKSLGGGWQVEQEEQLLK